MERTSKKKVAGAREVMDRLLAAGLLGDVVDDDGHTWQVIVVDGSPWEVAIQSRSVLPGRPRPIEITAQGPDVDAVIEGVRRFLADRDFRVGTFPPLPAPRPIKHGKHEDTSVEYKGRRYRLVWAGKTQFGLKAKLAFMDASKEFWVDLQAISDPQDCRPARRRGGYRLRECPNCGEELEDGSCWECGYGPQPKSHGSEDDGDNS
jgi:hypothetical protein